jgi:diguanylate cyclase (GGDEF)-like protein/PAS domain S-box-containing protein
MRAGLLKNKKIIVAVIATEVVFVIDLHAPLWYDVWVLYLIPLFLMYQSARRPYLYSVLVTLLIAAALFFAFPEGTSLMHATANRFTGILGGWGVSVLLMQLRRLHHSLLQTRDELAQRVEEKTGELSRANRLLREDVATRKEIENALRESEERYKSLFDSSMDGVYQVDADGVFTMINEAGARIFGFERPEEIVGTNALRFWRDPKDRDAYREELKARKSVSAYPIGAQKRDGDPIELESSSTILEDEDRNFLGIKGILRDVTGRARAEEDLRQLSLTDELTGLHNRRGFLILATQQIKNADRSGQGAALIYADMDRMKWVNDTFGHLEGDRALTDIAQILKKTLRASDIVARWGGDEFVALMTEATESAGETVFARLLETMDAHNMQENRPYQLSISFGITRYDPARPCALEELLERGDKLMYEKKQMRKMDRKE